MASEVSFRHSSTEKTLYFTIRSAARQMWNTAETPNFEELSVANWASYATAMTESPASSYFYVGDFPEISGNMVAGWYHLDVFEQAAGAPAISDALLASLFGYWDGAIFRWWAVDAVQINATLQTGADLGLIPTNPATESSPGALEIAAAATQEAAATVRSMLSARLPGTLGTKGMTDISFALMRNGVPFDITQYPGLVVAVYQTYPDGSQYGGSTHMYEISSVSGIWTKREEWSAALGYGTLSLHPWNDTGVEGGIPSPAFDLSMTIIGGPWSGETKTVRIPAIGVGDGYDLFVMHDGSIVDYTGLSRYTPPAVQSGSGATLAEIQSLGLAKEDTLQAVRVAGGLGTCATIRGQRIVVIRGDTARINFPILSADWDLTSPAGRKAYFTVKRRATDANSAAVLAEEAVIAGPRTLYYDPADTDFPTADEFVFDVEIRNADETKPVTAVKGTLLVEQDVRQ